ncbi:type I restriction endonuclease subunit R, EcoR124 family [Helicobacter suis]|uniref:type I restriction endonuclease subunit R, EcoR124 family n=1 Tax=Helicobacter suis TaxID=104628 RepID=UPI0013D08DBC|nr:hypothetical protein [Helicobacter suis]
MARNLLQGESDIRAQFRDYADTQREQEFLKLIENYNLEKEAAYSFMANGLSKILEKHINDFKDFEGTDIQEKLINGLTEIVAKGRVLENAGVYTIHPKNQKGSFRVGLSRGWNEQGDNHWIITAYKNN